ncbi:MAG: hypothetical protein LLG44_02570, partial [Chloroflexi bacterium]|nr:hypothetical protein [Chloroflexota bacterium]
MGAEFSPARHATLRTVLALLLLLMLCAPAQFSPVNAAQSEIPTAEYDALVALYNSTGGAGWTNVWSLPSDTPCSLYGVTCAGGHVTELALSSNSLVGQIPADIGGLTYLATLDLAGNDLQGPVPLEFASLTNVTSLDVGSNHLWTDLIDVRTFLNAQDPDWESTQVVTVAPVAQDAAASFNLAYPGGGEISVQVPTNSITMDVNMVLSPMPLPMTPMGMTYAGQSFSLGAYRDSNLIAGLAFSSPATLTIIYTDAQIDGLSESTLALYVRDGDNWINATDTCSPASSYQRDPDNNTLSVPVCHLSEFALFWTEQLEIPPAEYEALGTLNGYTGGDGWTNAWVLPTESPCSLYGVTCAGGHVTGLELNNNHLADLLPPAIGALTYLTSLNLAGNELQGPVPYEITSLTSLTTLDVSSNHLWTDLPDVRDFMDTLSPDWQDSQVVTVAPVSPDAAVSFSLDFPDNKIAVQVPANAITMSVNMVLTPLAAPGNAPTATLYAGQSFALGAYRDSSLISGLAFSRPATLTVTYSDAMITDIAEGSLKLYVRDGDNWVDAASTCSPQSSYLREPLANRLSVPICHLSEFA